MFNSKLEMLLYLESIERMFQKDSQLALERLARISKDINELQKDMAFDIQEYGLEYSDENYKVSVRKGRERIIIDDIEKIPKNMITTRTYTKEEPSKVAIKNAINEGHEIDGARLVIGDDSLSIKVK